MVANTVRHLEGMQEGQDGPSVVARVEQERVWRLSLDCLTELCHHLADERPTRELARVLCDEVVMPDDLRLQSWERLCKGLWDSLSVADVRDEAVPDVPDVHLFADQLGNLLVEGLVDLGPVLLERGPCLGLLDRPVEARAHVEVGEQVLAHVIHHIPLRRALFWLLWVHASE